jgi:hypothetical protein
MERRMNRPASPFPSGLPIGALVLAAVHIAFEYFTGGVQSHHLLQRADMPAMSNWLGLALLPLLGVAAGLSFRAQMRVADQRLVRRRFGGALVAAALYGLAMAGTFELGATNLTAVALGGLFVCGLVWPVYRAEYLLGFVAGMMFTFGSVIPTLIALIVGAASFVVRKGGGAILRRLRPPAGRPR